mmetsp:Transcript_4298/g.13421  ORF Transcript_4298/g.13421 Transcript_4298/m.13421 type:complete len:288 (-) Transcript_4298:260-1123(-)
MRVTVNALRSLLRNAAENCVDLYSLLLTKALFGPFFNECRVERQFGDIVLAMPTDMPTVWQYMKGKAKNMFNALCRVSRTRFSPPPPERTQYQEPEKRDVLADEVWAKIRTETQLLASRPHTTEERAELLQKRKAMEDVAAMAGGVRMRAIRQNYKANPGCVSTYVTKRIENTDCSRRFLTMRTSSPRSPRARRAALVRRRQLRRAIPRQGRPTSSSSATLSSSTPAPSIRATTPRPPPWSARRRRGTGGWRSPPKPSRTNARIRGTSTPCSGWIIGTTRTRRTRTT